MPKKRKKYNKNAEVRAIARERVGTPPATREIMPKSRRKKPKHKDFDLEQ